MLNNLDFSEQQKSPGYSKDVDYLDFIRQQGPPLCWPSTFFPYQIQGIEALVSMRALLLADDMGLGKTVQAIAAMRILISARQAERALIVVPANLLTQWRKQIRLWAPELTISTIKGTPDERAYAWSAMAHIFLVSYETLRLDFTHNPLSPPRRHIWDIVVLDEAQKIKNRDSETSYKCKMLPRRRAWALTGTPLENKLDELASILEFTQPLEPDARYVKFLPGSLMFSKHKELQLRRKKAEVLEQLPPKLVNTVTLSLSHRQRDSYLKAEREGILQLQERGQSIRIQNVLELILRLKQICNFCPQTGLSAKIDDLRARLNTLTAEGHKALVFSQFVDSKYGVAAVAAKLKDFNPLVYTGSLNQCQKDNVVKRFKSESQNKVLILSLRAGGQGLNLQEASYVFHFDHWWNPAVEHQAEDRSHRLGQTYPVTVYKYICEDTVEERIERILEQKQRLFDELVDDVTLDLQEHLSEAELYGLFGLKPPTQPAHH